MRSILTYLPKVCFGAKFIMVALSGYEERVTNTHTLPRLQRPQAKQFSYHLPSASSHLVLSSNISFQISSKGKNSIQQIIIYFVIHILLKFHTLGDRKEKQKLFRLWLYFKCHGELKWKEENLKWSDTSYVKKNFT